MSQRNSFSFKASSIETIFQPEEKDKQELENLKKCFSTENVKRMPWINFKEKLDQFLINKESKKKYESIDWLLSCAVNYAVPDIVSGLLSYGANPNINSSHSTQKNNKAIVGTVMQFFQRDYQNDKKLLGSQLQFESLKYMLLAGASVDDALYGSEDPENENCRRNLLENLYFHYKRPLDDEAGKEYSNESAYNLYPGDNTYYDLVRKLIAILLIVFPSDMIDWKNRPPALKWALSWFENSEVSQLQAHSSKGLNNELALKFLADVAKIYISEKEKLWLTIVKNGKKERETKPQVLQTNL